MAIGAHPDDIEFGDCSDVETYAVIGVCLLVMLTRCSSMISGSVARSSLSIASRRTLALFVSISRCGPWYSLTLSRDAVVISVHMFGLPF